MWWTQSSHSMPITAHHLRIADWPAARSPAAIRVISCAICCYSLACGSAVGTQNLLPIQGTSPRQFPVSGDLQIQHHPDPDSAILIFSVTTIDSTPHIEWRPTTLRVESDLGYDSTVLAVPFTCLEPNNSGLSFPFNFTWRSCNRIGVETDSVLSESQVADLKAIVTGRLVESHPFQTVPGAFSIFKVPVGREATAEAVRRAQGFAYVRNAFRISMDPECVRSDILPPPPCPPWFLFVRLPYSRQASPGDSIPVRSGGWVRARYIDVGGSQHVVEYSVP